MEEHVFPAPAVAGKLKQMIEARIHNDGTSQEEVRAWQNDLLGTFATPSYALIDPANGEVLLWHEGPESDPDKFAAWLEEALQSWRGLP
ncbi:MAG: hypothetical protein ABGY71_13620 [bacterium]|jgi:hypothetical protein